jgi:hypothetical protein
MRSVEITMPGNSSWLPYAPQGVAGLDDDDDDSDDSDVADKFKVED